jgi:uncharacterized membrane protein
VTPLLAVHVAAGIAALPLGAAAFALPKGGPGHRRAGTGFALSMLVLGASAALLEPYRVPPGSPVSGIMVCYFVATAWVAARRRNGETGRFEIAACASAWLLAAAIGWGALTGATTPAGRGPVFALALLCLLAGSLDLNAVLRRPLSPRQRLARHSWRMGFAFFIATGSFFLGQQKALPAAVRGSPILLALAFAPLAAMLFWLVRLRFAKTDGRSAGRPGAAPGGGACGNEGGARAV